MNHRQNPLKCAYCPDSVQLMGDFKTGNLVCTGCGLVIGHREVDVCVERRSNDTLLNENRISPKESVPCNDLDMSAIICPNGGSNVAYEETGEQKLRNKKYRSSSQMSLLTGFKEMAEKLNTTQPVIESGQLILEKIRSKRALKGRSNDSIAAACLYIACRKNNVPRTFKEMCAVAKSSKKDITRCYKAMSKVIGEVSAQSSVVHYIPRFSANLELPSTVQDRARHLVERFESLDILSCHSPITVAAVAIVMATDCLNWNPKGQTGNKFPFGYMIEQIAKVTGASLSAIREAQKVVKAQGGEELAEYFNSEQTLPQQQLSSAVHLGMKSYSCTWPDCKYFAEQSYRVVKHIRVVHFKLPKYVKKQIELNIIDDRDPYEFVRVDRQLFNRRH